MKQLNLFVISSPLQLLTVTNIQLQFPKKHNENSILFVEGERYHHPAANDGWDEIVIANYVRPRIDNLIKNIRLNLQSIDTLLTKHKPTRVKLFISDLYWVSNNVIFAYLLKRFKDNMSCALFDEGCALYTKPDLSYRDRMRSFIKWMALKTAGMPYLILHKKSFDQGNPLIHSLYCYHPELFTGERLRKSIGLNPELLQSFLAQLTKLNEPTTIRQKTLLFLSQPYHLYIPMAELKIIMNNMKDYFQKKGVNEFFLKPHHLDKPEWKNILENELGFKTYTGNVSIGIEAAARYLDFEYVVAFSSSALLNLKKFGYRGEVVSYGREQIGRFRQIRKINKKVYEIYTKKAVTMVG